MSLHNFFFMAFDPGGFLALDKPPLGIWVQAFCAWSLGLSGIALHIPRVFLGSLSVVVLYLAMKGSFGRVGAGASALVLTFTPLWVATCRTTFVDVSMNFVLLLAALAAITAVREGRPGFVIVCGALVGVAFNVKYVQALMVLPALAAYLLLSNWLPVGRRLRVLLVALAVLFELCLGWGWMVSCTPPDSRPFIESSEDNTVGGLMRRLITTRFNGIANAPEVGPPGAGRLVTMPLAGIMGWLFPLAVAGLLAAGAAGHREQKREALLWATWLFVGWGFFSFSRGVVHVQYLAMLTPPIATGVGMLFATGGRWAGRSDAMALVVPLLLALDSVFLTLRWSSSSLGPLLPSLPLLALLTAGILGLVPPRLRLSSAAWRQDPLALALVGSLAPAAAFCWLLTCEVPLGFPMGHPLRTAAVVRRLARGDRLVAYLTAHRQGEKFLVATDSVQTAAPVILGTGQAVMTLGGYGGTDLILDGSELGAVVRAGKVRFLLLPDSASRPSELMKWARLNGREVPAKEWGPSAIFFCREPADARFQLFDCAPPERRDGTGPGLGG